MNKRLLSLLLCLCLVFALCLPALGYVDHNLVYTAVNQIDNDRLRELGEETLPQLSDRLNFQLRVDIVDTVEDYTLEGYAELFYNQYDYGYGEGHDGSLLMILLQDNSDSVDISDYIVYGGGTGQTLVRAEGTDQMYQNLDSLLTGSALDYSDAGETIADAIEVYLGVMNQVILEADPEQAEAIGEDAGGEEPMFDEPDSTEETAGAVVDDTMDAIGDTITDLIAPAASGATGMELIRDEAGLLDSDDRDRLEQKAQSLADQYQCNVYVLTVDSTGGMNRREFAKQYYRNNDLGYGDGKNGILFLVAMESREYVTITYGKDPANPSEYGTGIYAFSDYGVSQLEDKVVPYLSKGDYEGAFDTYVDTCGSYLKQYTETGEPFDVGTEPHFPLFALLITILVPLLIAFVVCMIFKSQMKTAVAATEAGNYVSDGGLTLTRQQDNYTHTTRSVRHIQREQSSHGGGSSVDSSGFGGSSGGHF